MAEEKKPYQAAKPATAVKKTDEKLSFGQRTKKWWREMKSELKKVSWPGTKQVTNNTLVALVSMFISAGVLGGFDEWGQMVIRLLIDIGA